MDWKRGSLAALQITRDLTKIPSIGAGERCVTIGAGGGGQSALGILEAILLDGEGVGLEGLELRDRRVEWRTHIGLSKSVVRAVN